MVFQQLVLGHLGTLIEVQISFLPEAHGQVTCANTLLRGRPYVAAQAL